MGEASPPFSPSVELFPSELFSEDIIDKQGISDEVAFGEAVGFLPEAEEPFEGKVFHPLRGMAQVAGEVVETGADGDEDAALQAVEVFVDPAFLFGSAEGDPDDIGPGRVDLLKKIDVLLFAELFKGRRDHAGDHGAREALLDNGAHSVECFGSAAEEKMAQAVLLTPIDGFFQQGGAEDAGDFIHAAPFHQQRQGPAVGQRQRRFVDDAAVFGIARGHDQGMGVVDGQIGALFRIAAELHDHPISVIIGIDRTDFTAQQLVLELHCHHFFSTKKTIELSGIQLKYFPRAECIQSARENRPMIHCKERSSTSANPNCSVEKIEKVRK